MIMFISCLEAPPSSTATTTSLVSSSATATIAAATTAATLDENELTNIDDKNDGGGRDGYDYHEDVHGVF